MNIRSYFLGLIWLTGSVHAEIRTWTNTTGQTVQAEMIGVDASSRTLRMRNAEGRDFSLSIESLSPADLAYAKAQWAASTSSPSPATSPGASSPRFASLCSEAARAAQVRKNGGSSEIESAVTRSLDWLKIQQGADGSWGRNNRAGLTGFALQCYTDRCETADSKVYGDTIMRGLLYLLELAKKNPHGMFSERWQNGATSTYEHAISTKAVGELYALSRGAPTKMPGLEEAYQKAVRTIVVNQNKKGSWTYGGEVIAYTPDSNGEDLSLTNWHLEALEGARALNLEVKGLDACISKAVAYLDEKQTKDGGFGSTNKDMHYNQWYLSGGAINGLQTLASGREGKIIKGVRFLKGFITEEPLDWNKNCNLYSWHSYTHAFFNAGSEDWSFYKSQLLPQVLAAQQPDGSFKIGRADWPAAHAADPIYRQALCTLQLEVFFRERKTR